MFEQIAVVIGSVLIVSSWFPQIAKLYKTKSARDISIKFLVIVTLGTALLVPHSINLGDIFFIILNSSASFVSGITMLLAINYRKHGSTVDSKTE